MEVHCTNDSVENINKGRDAMNQLIRNDQSLDLLLAALKAESAVIDDETLVDTLENLSDVMVVVAEVARSCIADDTLAGALRRRIDEMRERLARIEAAREIKRDLTLKALQHLSLGKLVEPDFTVSIRSGAPFVALIDETAVPAKFWVPQEPKLNKGAL